MTADNLENSTSDLINIMNSTLQEARHTVQTTSRSAENAQLIASSVNELWDTSQTISNKIEQATEIAQQGVAQADRIR